MVPLVPHLLQIRLDSLLRSSRSSERVVKVDFPATLLRRSRLCLSPTGGLLEAGHPLFWLHGPTLTNEFNQRVHLIKHLGKMGNNGNSTMKLFNSQTSGHSGYPEIDVTPSTHLNKWHQLWADSWWVWWVKYHFNDRPLQNYHPIGPIGPPCA